MSALVLGGWNVLQQQLMSQRKAHDISNCSLVLQSVPVPCENDGVSYGSSIYSWSRTTIGPEVDLHHWRSVMIQAALQRCCRKSSLYSTFCKLKETTHAHHWCWIHPFHPNYRWALHYWTVLLLLACVYSILGFAVQRKEIQFVLRVPLLA